MELRSGGFREILSAAAVRSFGDVSPTYDLAGGVGEVEGADVSAAALTDVLNKALKWHRRRTDGIVTGDTTSDHSALLLSGSPPGSAA